MSQIETITSDLRDSFPPFESVDSVNDRINKVRGLSNYKSLLFVLKNSDFAKLYLEKEFEQKKSDKNSDMFLFSIILAFFDINDLEHSVKLARSLFDYNEQHWTSLLAKTHLLYVSLYDPRQVI